MSVLAIDAGTTGITALVILPDGTVAARGYAEFAQHFPRPGWVEHVPEEIWQAILAACRQALDGAGGGTGVGGRAGAAGNAPIGGSGDDSGCGCRVGRSPSSSSVRAIALVIALSALRRRRRAKRV